MATGKEERSDVAKPLELTTLERLWLKKSLDLQRSALVRSRSKEMAGSEIYELRSREIKAVNDLAEKFL